MRVVDILCVVVVTKHLVTSDASSTPADYSTHSLISVDTPDAVRALRVGDESDIQEERGLSFADPMLRYTPGTAAHGAAKVAEIAETAKVAEIAEAAKVAEIAKVAKIERLLQFELISPYGRKEYISVMLKTRLKWDVIKRLLANKVEPEYFKKFFLMYGKKKKSFKWTLEAYTSLYKELAIKELDEASIHSAAEEAVNIVAAQNAILEATGIPKDGLKEWSQSLSNADTEWDQFTTMVLNYVRPDDLRIILQENGMEKPKVDSHVHTYSKMYNVLSLTNG